MAGNVRLNEKEKRTVGRTYEEGTFKIKQEDDIAQGKLNPSQKVGDQTGILKGTAETVRTTEPASASKTHPRS